MKKNRIIAMMLAVVMVFTLAIVPASAEGTKSYTFNISDIPQNQWDAARKRILIHVTKGDQTYDVTIPDSTEGMGHAVLMGLPIYENGVKMENQDPLGITLVPVRLLSETLGIPIDWNGEKGTVEFDTYKGHISIPIGAISITMPDGSTWQETTYAYPDGSPIQLAMLRGQENRTYLPIRAFSSIAFEESEWNWHNTAYLEGWITIPETNSKAEWTEEQKQLLDYVWNVGSTGNIAKLPNTAKVLEETGADAGNFRGSLQIEPQDIVTGNSISIKRGNLDNELWIQGLHNFIGMHPEVKDQDYLKILKAVLLDIVPDENDALAIGEVLDEVEKYAAVAGNPNTPEEEADVAGNIAAEMISKEYEYNSVIVQWHRDWMGQYVSITKK